MSFEDARKSVKALLVDTKQSLEIPATFNMHSRAIAKMGLSLTQEKERILLAATQRRLGMPARLEDVVHRMVLQIDRIGGYESYLLDRLPLVCFSPPDAKGDTNQVTATLKYQDFKEYD